jgi:translation initiation factor IF-2
LSGDIESKTLNLIIKADVAGSLEAIKQSIAKLKNDEVKISILGEGIGEVNDNDVLLASSSKATVIAFRAKVGPKSAALAKAKQVTIDSYDVIYELIEDVTSAVIKMFTPEIEKLVFGKGKILGIFRTEKGQMIIGGRVEEGEIKKQGKVAIWRDGTEMGTGEIMNCNITKLYPSPYWQVANSAPRLKPILKSKKATFWKVTRKK